MAGWCNVNHLSPQCMDQRIVLTFRIAYNHIILSHEEDITDLTLGGERFTGTRCAQNQTIGVLQLLPIHHDHIVAEGIQPVIE